MSRTPLFAAVKKALAVASHENGVLGADEAAIVATLRSGGRRAGARTRLGPARLRQEARTELDCHRRRGVAGLTAAYRLQQHGAKPVLFEASNRWGGRMFTQYDLYKGMF